MPSEDIAISARNLTKTYRLFGHPGDRIKQFFSLGLKRYHQEFTALKDVSFDITKGEAIGIVGRNGSGKSTLLQVICGILKPSAGTVRVNGRTSALLELGAGFNPEFTGRENVYFQGSLMGLSRKAIGERFDHITAFADIGDYIDQPVRTYSSGMFVRLAFAVATDTAPEIFVVDEALAVGDLAFQSKCFSRIREMIARGTTLLLVSHSLNDVVRHCSRAILLDSGVIAMDGTPETVARRYLAGIADLQAHPIDRIADVDDLCDGPDDALLRRSYYRPQEYRWGLGGARILDCDLLVDGFPYQVSASTGALLTLAVTARFAEDISAPVYGLILHNIESRFTVSTNSHVARSHTPAAPAKRGQVVRYQFQLPLTLEAGKYHISVGISSEVQGYELVPLDRRYEVIAIEITGRGQCTPLTGDMIRFALED